MKEKKIIISMILAVYKGGGGKVIQATGASMIY